MDASDRQTSQTQMKFCISSGSALFAKIKTIFRDRNTSIEPLKIDNGLSHPYYINMYWKIHKYNKGFYNYDNFLLTCYNGPLLVY